MKDTDIKNAFDKIVLSDESKKKLTHLKKKRNKGIIKMVAALAAACWIIIAFMYVAYILNSNDGQNPLTEKTPENNDAKNLILNELDILDIPDSSKDSPIRLSISNNAFYLFLRANELGDSAMFKVNKSTGELLRVSPYSKAIFFGKNAIVCLKDDMRYYAGSYDGLSKRCLPVTDTEFLNFYFPDDYEINLYYSISTESGEVEYYCYNMFDQSARMLYNSSVHEEGNTGVDYRELQLIYVKSGILLFADKEKLIIFNSNENKTYVVEGENFDCKLSTCYAIYKDTIYFTKQINSNEYEIYRVNTDGKNLTRFSGSHEGSAKIIITNNKLYYKDNVKLYSVNLRTKEKIYYQYHLNDYTIDNDLLLIDYSLIDSPLHLNIQYADLSQDTSVQTPIPIRTPTLEPRLPTPTPSKMDYLDNVDYERVAKDPEYKFLFIDGRFYSRNDFKDINKMKKLLSGFKYEFTVDEDDLAGHRFYYHNEEYNVKIVVTEDMGLCSIQLYSQDNVTPRDRIFAVANVHIGMSKAEMYKYFNESDIKGYSDYIDVVVVDKNNLVETVVFKWY